MALWLTLSLACVSCGEALYGSGFEQDLTQYWGSPPYKAFAVAFDDEGGHRAWGWARNRSTLKEAIDGALDACEERRRELGVTSAPRLYALNNEIVFDYSDAALAEYLARFRSTAGWKPNRGR
jgi:hypothetical protein